MPYFTIMTELRGCYADNDSAHTYQFATRRELKNALEWEARDIRDAGGTGVSKRAIASLAAMAWRNRKSASPYPSVLGFRYAHNSRGSAPMGIFVYNATRSDYLAQDDMS